MKTLPAAFAVGCAARSPQAKPPLPSRDGLVTLHTSVERSHRATAYGCVIVEVRDRSGQTLYRQNSHASGFQRWDIAWIANDEFKLTSSDIGPSTWTRQPDGTWNWH